MYGSFPGLKIIALYSSKEANRIAGAPYRFKGNAGSILTAASLTFNRKNNTGEAVMSTRSGLSGQGFYTRGRLEGSIAAL
jgi:hypothetical protein